MIRLTLIRLNINEATANDQADNNESFVIDEV